MTKKQLQQLIKAVTKSDPSRVNRLLNQGVDPNACLDDDAVTALHYAAQYNAINVVPLLIAAGADINAMTFPDGYTPLELALVHKHFRFAQLLLMYNHTTENLH